MNLLQVLIKEGDLSSSHAASVEKFTERWGVSSFVAVLECNLVSEKRLADVISKAMHLGRFNRENLEEVSLESFEKIPFSLALKWGAFPLGWSGQSFKVLITDPTDQIVVAGLKDLLKMNVLMVVGERQYVRTLIHGRYPLHLQAPGLAGV